MHAAITAYKTPDEAFVEELKELFDICKEFDQVAPKIYWYNLKWRSPKVPKDYVYRIEGKMVGYLGFFEFSEDEIEVCAMIHPEHRQQGIFTELLNAGKPHFNVRFAFPCARTVTAAQKCMESIKAVKGKSEYLMTRDSIKREEVAKSPVDILPAVINDAEIMAKIDKECFGANEAEMVARYQEALLQPNRKVWLIKLRKTTVGKVHVRLDKKQAFLHEIAVFPEYQNQGYATLAVKRVINQLLGQHYRDMRLEVFANNENALKVYQRCHFEVAFVYDFWYL